MAVLAPAILVFLLAAGAGSSLVIPLSDLGSHQGVYARSGVGLKAIPTRDLSGPRPSLRDAAGGLGSVTATLDLATNQLHPGSAVIGVQDAPEIPVYDPSNGNIYIRGNVVNDISVVNASTFTDVANIPAAIDDQSSFLVPSIAVDTQTGYVYATNSVDSNVSVINGATESVTGSIVTGGSPRGIAFDRNNHDFYVANFGTHNVTVFSGTTNTFVATIQAGTDPLAVAYDPASDRVFVTNYGSSNVSVINPATNTLSTTVTVGTGPVAVTLDTVDDLVDVLDYTGGTGEVSVFSATSPMPSATTVTVGNFAESFAFDSNSDQLFVAGAGGSLTAIAQPANSVVRTDSIGTGSAYDATAYDPVDNDVYVSAYDGGPGSSGNVTVISGASDRSIANDTTNNGPMGVVVDPGTGDAYVVNTGTGSYQEANVTVLGEATGLPVASIPLVVVPSGVAYDSAEHAIYVVDNGGNDIYRVDDTTGRVVGVETGGPHPTASSLSAPIVYDGANGDIYTADATQETVDVFGPSHSFLTAIPVGLYPVALAYDNVSDLLFVAQDYNGNVSIIDTTTNTVLSASLLVEAYQTLDAVAYDPHSNEVYVADGGGNNVTVWGALNHTKVRTVPVGMDPTSIVVDPANHTVFVANLHSANVSVLNDTTNTVVHSVSLTDPYLLTYDSATGTVYNAEYFENVVGAFNATTYAPLSGSPLNLGDGAAYGTQGIAYDSSNGFLYVSDSLGGALNTIGTGPTYPVQFVESGLLSGTSWSVTLNSVANTSTTNTVGFREPTGNYPFSVGSVSGYTVNNSSGTVPVTNGPKTVYLLFTAHTPTLFPVTFIETGLPSSALWNVTLNSVQNHSTTNSIGFLEPSGNYAFAVGQFTGYVANKTIGNVAVTSSAVTVYIGFTAVSATFPVTFIESGLPASTLWQVTFNGGPNSSTTTSIGFRAADGMYPFTVGTVAGYSANVSSGEVTVAGSARTVYIGFSAGTIPLTVTLAAHPASISLGDSTTLAATTSGGTSPYSYVYSGLPGGCLAQNSSGFSCTPNATGSFSVVVVVTDAHGATAHASTTLNVTAVSKSSSPSGISSLWIVIAVVVVAAVLAILFVVSRRRRKPSTAPSSPAPTTPPESPPPS